MAKAIWKDVVLAESDDIVIVEGNPYFPTESLHSQYFQASDETSYCPWKGTAHYHTIVVNGESNSGAAWYYPEPKEAAKQIKDRVAFWRGVVVEE